MIKTFKKYTAAPKVTKEMVALHILREQLPGGYEYGFGGLFDSEHHLRNHVLPECPIREFTITLEVDETTTETPQDQS